MPETIKSLLEKREILMNRADAVRARDPKLADYLDKLGNDMDGELEGTEDIQQRDENGFLQGEDPGYLAHQEAQSKIFGQPWDQRHPLATSPTYQAAVQTTLGDLMRQNFEQQMQPQYQTPEGAQYYNNSVTPSAGSMKKFETTLTPAEEKEFRSWKSRYAPKDSGEDYDLRGAFKAGLVPDPETGHWPDTFKKPNHPTFSVESQYAPQAPEMAGRWNGESFVPPQQYIQIGPEEVDPRLQEILGAQ